MMQVRTRGRVITFYSYKGGTGRSMTLANVAWILATNGKKVLVIDWDLEAPGLHRYFSPFLLDRQLTDTEGLIDFVIEFATETMTRPAEGESHDPNWYVEYADILRYAVSLDWDFGSGTLDFICAGRQDVSYSTRVNTFDWRSFYDRQGGGVFLEEAMRQAQAEYDFILIDSRTGVSDTSGICTVQAPHALVVCFTLNNQSIDGAANVAASVFEQRRALEQQNRIPKPQIFPVPMRVENAEKDKLKARRKYARKRFALFPDHLPDGECERYWNDVEVLYVPYYAYEEVLSTFVDEPGATLSMLGSIERLIRYLTDGAVTHAVSLPEEERAAILARYARGGAVEIETSELDAAAESVFAELSAEDQSLARRLFTSLVRVAPQEEGGRITGLRVPLSRVALAREVVRRFATEDLLKLDRDPAVGEETVQLANEALIAMWARFKQWIDADREFLLWRQQLRVFIADWESNRRDSRSLLTGPTLETAHTWLQQRGTELAADELAFIVDSEANQTKQQQEHAALTAAAARPKAMDAFRSFRRSSTFVILLAVVAGIVFLYTRFEHREPDAALDKSSPSQRASLESSPSQVKAFELVRQADDELQADRSLEAIELYTRALALIQNPAWLVKRGIAYDQQRAFDEAKRDYDQAIALNPDLVDAYLNRAASHYAAKDYAAALADYDRVIALAPKHAQAYFNRGATHDALGNAQVAIKDYTRTIELRPDYADAYFNRGLDYLSLGKRDLAVEDFKAVLDLDADPQILTTARAHLEKLDTSAAAVRPTATPRVYLHYGDVRHAPQQLEEISAALARQDYKVFSSKGAERRSGGDVRYFYKADEQAAANVKQIVEGILARQGFPVSLDLRPLSPEDVTDTSNKDTQSGAIEVWLPPLSQRIPIQRNAPNLPARSKELQD